VNILYVYILTNQIKFFR